MRRLYLSSVDATITGGIFVAGLWDRIARLFRIKHIMIIYFTITALRLVILELVILPKDVFAKLLDRLAR
jgi:hypothetical protein